jgi:hypothetical protein
MRRAVARLLSTGEATPDADTLADQLLGIADSLDHTLNQAATRDLAIPPAITNSIHDLRGWACRMTQGSTTATATVAVDANRLLRYLRGLPDHQLLALLADLPWARLDVLLDAVNATPQSRSPRPRP